MYRKTYMEINEDYLKENVENILSEYSDYKYYFGVVKANCYGHGEHVIKTLLEAGINYLAVSSLEEAISVRKETPKTPILCFGYIGPKDLPVAIENNITVTILSKDHANELFKVKEKNYKVHIKLNTGMNRVGINDKFEVKELVDRLKELKIELEGIYTHFATSGVLDYFWDNQIKKFEELVSLINLEDIKIVHLFNSLSLVKHDKKRYANGVRIGIVMYGYSSSVNDPKGVRKLAFEFRKKLKTKGINISPVYMTNNLKLKKVLTLKSEVTHVSNCKKGEEVGYKADYILKEDARIAVVPIGHADGITKYYKNVEINNKLYEIVALTMDSIMVKVDKNVNMHDEVTVIGDKIPLSKIANSSEISIHQVLVSIQNRVPRVYIKNNKKTEVKY